MSRLIIISNRLPVTIDKKEGALFLHPSAGGLATGLRSLEHEHDTIWIGWPGGVIKSPKQKKELQTVLMNEFQEDSHCKLHPLKSLKIDMDFIFIFNLAKSIGLEQ